VLVHDGSTGREVRVLGDVADQEAAEESCLDLEKSPIAQAVSEERMGDLVVEAPLEGGDEALASVVGEVHRPPRQI
jgi:hypothetical protein